MDLSTFQLVDVINDMDMLRNLSGQQQQQQVQYSQSQQSSNHNAYSQLNGDIDLLFQSDQLNASPHGNSFNSYKTNCTSTTGASTQSNQIMSSPHYKLTSNNQQQQQNEYFEQEVYNNKSSSRKNNNDKTMTPSFSYQKNHYQQQAINYNNGNNEIDFSPLSSPAILPQIDRHNRNQSSSRTSFQDQLVSSVVTDSNRDSTGESYNNMSANQICEQYEQLEHAKMLITQKLSELQKSQLHHSHQLNDDHGYKRSLFSSESNSPNNSHSSLLNTNGLQQQQQQHNDHMLIQHKKINSPNKSPSRMEPATPASLMNMKSNTNQTSKLLFSSSGRTQQVYSKSTSSAGSTPSTTNYNSMIPTNKNHIFQSPNMTTTTTPVHETMIISPMMTPTPHQNTPPPSSIHTNNARNSALKEKPNSSRFPKKQRRESSDTKISNGVHASPRALKPLLISPTLNPGLQPLPSSMMPNTQSVHSVEDAEHILATRSNYQNLMEGKGAALGIAFSTQIKSGLEIRRTAHKAAEQKRRDSLKEWFDRLRCEVEDGYVKRQKKLMSQVIKAQELEKNNNNNNKQRGNSTTDEEIEEASSNVDASAMKPLSKVLLLQYAYEYIASLKQTLEERDATIEKLLSDELGRKSSIGHLKRRQEEEEEIHNKNTDESDSEMNYDYL
ncbi:hypothetical protein BD770DRAFT_385702 [Pilaira anomala]|nr:hypothetical protein BD770DRAFT_385702 [Pilaira anomala]